MMSCIFYLLPPFPCADYFPISSTVLHCSFTRNILNCRGIALQTFLLEFNVSCFKDPACYDGKHGACVFYITVLRNVDKMDFWLFTF